MGAAAHVSQSASRLLDWRKVLDFVPKGSDDDGERYAQAPASDGEPRIAVRGSSHFRARQIGGYPLMSVPSLSR